MHEGFSIRGRVLEKPFLLRRLLAQDDIPRPYTKFANSPTSTIHVTVAHELTSKSEFAKRATYFANSPSLQSCPSVTTVLGISRAPTSVVRVRAQKMSRL